MTISMIVAVSANYGIGINNQLPWPFNAEDMQWFRKQTIGRVVVMGSSTWDSLPVKPLPKRTNVVLTSRRDITADVVLSDSPEFILESLSVYDDIVIMGGARVYRDFLPFVDRLLVTRIPEEFDCDTYLNIDEHINNLGFVLQETITGEQATYETWTK